MNGVGEREASDSAAESISSELLINVIRTLTTTVSNDQRQLEKQRIEQCYRQSEQNIDKLLKEHRSDALHCLSTFQSVSKELTSSREQIRNIKSSLSLCKTFLQCRRDDLNKFWLENAQQKKVCDILQQIQQIKKIEKTVDVQLANGEYKEMIRVLKDADVLLKGPFDKMEGISQLKFVVSENLQKVFGQIVNDLLQCVFVEPFEAQTLEAVKSGKMVESKIGAALIERYPKKKLVALNDEGALRLRLAELLQSLLVFGQVDKALDEMFDRMPNLFLRLSNGAAEVVKQSAGGERSAGERDASHLAKFVNIAIAQMSFASRNFALLSLELQQLSHQFLPNCQPIMKRFWHIVQVGFEEILAEYLLVWRNKKDGNDGAGGGGVQKKALFSFENASFVSSVNASSRKKQFCVVCTPDIYNVVAIFHKLSALCREVESQLGEDCCYLSVYLQTFVAEAFLEQIRVDLERQTESVLNGADLWSSMSDVPPHTQRILSCCVRVFELCERINGYIVSMEPYALRFASFWLLILEHFIKGFSDKYFQIVMLRQVHADGGWADYPKLSAAWVVDEDISRLLMSLPSWSAVKKSPFSPDQIQTPFAADVVNLANILGESEQEIRERTQRESEILIGNLGTQKQPKSSELITSMDHIKALACLHESLQWFVGKMRALVDGLSSRAKELTKTRIQITTSGNGGTLIDQMLCEAIAERINTLEKLSDNLLLILHLELRFHCFFHLITITQNQSALSLLSQDEIDRDVMEFGRDLSQFHATLHAHLSPTKLKYLFDGLGYLCSSIFIHSCQYLTKLSEMGRKRICRAIFSVQKYLSQLSGRPETELQRAQIFFDFLNKDLDQLFATIVERGAVFSFVEYSILLSLLIRSHSTLNSQPGVLEAATNQLRDILSHQQKGKPNQKPISSMVGTEAANFSLITHVIFDLDGVLIDTERHYTTANERAMEKFGSKFTRELKLMMMGRKKSEAVPLLLKDAGLAGRVTSEQYMEEYDQHLKQIMSTLTEELPGATKLIDHFYAQNIPLAICTGSDSEEFGDKMRKFDKWLQKIPIRVLCGSDPEVRNGKPHPDAYEVTMGRFVSKPVSPKNVLVFEDSINGVESALGAGCSVVMVPQREFLPKDWPEKELRSRANFAALLDSLEHFCPKPFGLPDFRLREGGGCRG
uniref:Exocyst complex component Sec8 n=1 Tax=Globodera rostochiensis TaxID=31243 RepID=A0A914I9R7_GLORO